MIKYMYLYVTSHNVTIFQEITATETDRSVFGREQKAGTRQGMRYNYFNYL